MQNDIIDIMPDFVTTFSGPECDLDFCNKFSTSEVTVNLNSVAVESYLNLKKKDVS